MERTDEVAQILGGLFASALGCGIFLAVLAFIVLIWWRIFSKAGYSGALSLLMLIPLVNLVLICVLAFGQWPIERELEALKSMPRHSPYPPTPSGPGV